VRGENFERPIFDFKFIKLQDFNYRKYEDHERVTLPTSQFTNWQIRQEFALRFEDCLVYSSRIG
jgi:hypothetical protein